MGRWCMDMPETLRVNRALVLTLWAAVVASGSGILQTMRRGDRQDVVHHEGRRELGLAAAAELPIRREGENFRARFSNSWVAS